MSSMHATGAAPWPWTVDSHMDDWYALHDANGRYISDACVEGNSEDMLSLAAGLRTGQRVSHKRCAAWFEGGEWRFHSPRNTMGGYATLPLDRAADLADIIKQAVKR